MRVTSGITLDHVTKRFDSVTAVADLSLSIGPGEIVCVLGPNGAGKTTVLHMIMGLKTPTRGNVLIDGVSIHSPGIEAVRRRIGHMPEQPVLYDYLTGREFVQFVGRLYETDCDLDAWLEPRLVALQMSEGADRLIKTYSMGMRKKIAFLAALVHNPSILIFDEPTGSLDAVSARIVKDEMQAARGEGAAVLFTTHIMEIAERLSDRVAIMTAGRLVAEGSLDDLRATHGRHARESLEDLFLRLTREETEPEPGR